jgi:hypothetical protein
MEDRCRQAGLTLEQYYDRKAPVEHFLPVSWAAAPWADGRRFLWETKKGVLNYVLVRPLCSIVTIYSETRVSEERGV